MMKCQRSMALSGKGFAYFLILGCMCGIVRLLSDLPAIKHICSPALTLHFCTEKYIFHTADRRNWLFQIGEDFYQDFLIWQVLFGV